jgi:hypothetical protein
MRAVQRLPVDCGKRRFALITLLIAIYFVAASCDGLRGSSALRGRLNRSKESAETLTRASSTSLAQPIAWAELKEALRTATPASLAVPQLASAFVSVVDTEAVAAVYWIADDPIAADGVELEIDGYKKIHPISQWDWEDNIKESGKYVHYSASVHWAPGSDAWKQLEALQESSVAQARLMSGQNPVTGQSTMHLYAWKGDAQKKLK